MYTVVFTISLNIIYWIFYVFVFYGSHGFSKQDLADIGTITGNLSPGLF